MTTRRTRILGIALTAVLSLAACDDGGSKSSDASGTTGFEEVDDSPIVPETAGPLTGRQMPPASALGTGWTERADPGSDDEGETDPNAPSTQKRDVGELMDGLVPIGCPDAAVNVELPRPEYALERTYAGPDGAPGVALVLQFADTAGSSTFIDAMERQLRACPAGKADPDGPIVLQFSTVARSPEQVSAIRQEKGVDADPNKYLLIAVRDGGRVGLVYLGGTPAAKAKTIGPDLIKAIRTA